MLEILLRDRIASIQAGDHVEGARQKAAVLFRHARQLGGEQRDAAPAPRVQETAPLGRGAQVLDATVVRVCAPHDQAAPLERLHEPRDRRHADLFGLGEPRDGDGTGEDDHRQRRQARRAQARRRVRDADAAQQPDGTRVEPIGQLQGLTFRVGPDIT